MADDAASTADIMGQIRRLRQEFGSAICDVIMAELIRGQKTSDLMQKLGLNDPGYGLERVQILVNYLRQNGATEFVCHITSPHTNGTKSKAAMQTIQVDPVLLKHLISSDQGRAHQADATIIAPHNVLDQYIERLFDETSEERDGALDDLSDAPTPRLVQPDEDTDRIPFLWGNPEGSPA